MTQFNTDVNQNGQNQPPVTASAQEPGQNNIASNPIEDVKDGKPYKNMYVEADRKLQKANEEAQYWKNFAEQQSQILQNFKTNNQQNNNAHSEGLEEPELTEEHLYELEQSSPENALKVRQYREDRLTKKILRNIENQFLPRMKAFSEADRWDQKAMQEFPEINNKNSAFRNAVVEELSTLKNGGYSGADIAYRAAQTASLRFPNMARNRNQAIDEDRNSALAQHSMATNISSQQKLSVPSLTNQEKFITNQFGHDEDAIAKRVQAFREANKQFKRGNQ